MTIFEIIFYGLGLWVGNIIGHRFINKRSWKDSIIIGAIMFVIFFLVMLLLKEFSIIGGTIDYDNMNFN